MVKLHYRGLIASTRVFSQLELLDPKKRLHIGSSELSVGPRFIVGPKEIQGEIVMYTVHSDRRQIFWLATLLAVVFTFILAACGSSTGTGTGASPTPTPTPTYTTVKGYGTTYGCPSDIVVNPQPSTPNVVINVTQSNSTITAHSGNIIEVHLPFGQTWHGPSASQGVLDLQTPYGYALKDKGVCVWRFVAQGSGTTKLTFTGRAICKQGQLCPQYVLKVPFTVKVD